MFQNNNVKIQVDPNKSLKYLEKKMKINILTLGSLLSLSTTVFSSDELSMIDLKSYIIEKPEIVAYMKDMINTPNRDIVMEDLISPNENHHGLNFKEINQQMSDASYWWPQKIVFSDHKLEEFLAEYKRPLQDIDAYNIFRANTLYNSGSQFYSETKNSEFLEYAASIGHPRAQYAMFSISLKSKEYPAARNYILSAAAQKNPEALLKLSEIYQGGYQRLSFPKNLEMARKLCKEAEILGNKEAEFRIQVATLTEGFFGCKVNYQQGIMNAKTLENKGNKRAKKFIKAIMESSADSLMEGNELITQDDIEFLKNYLGWEDE